MNNKLVKRVGTSINDSGKQLRMLASLRVLKVAGCTIFCTMCLIGIFLVVVHIAFSGAQQNLIIDSSEVDVRNEVSTVEPDILYEAYLVTYPGVVYCDFDNNDLRILSEKYRYRKVDYAESEFFVKTLLQDTQIVFPTLVVRKVVKGTVVDTEFYFGRKPILEHIASLQITQ